MDNISSLGRVLATKRKELSKIKGIVVSQDAIAKQIPVSRAAYAKWEGGNSAPTPDKWIAIERVFGEERGWIAKVLGGISEQPAYDIADNAVNNLFCGVPPTPLDKNVDLDNALPVSSKLVPLISWVTAGAFCGIVDNFHPGDAEEWIGCDVHVGENAFALEIVGDSMETEFRNGDRIIIDPSRQWENGSFVVVKIGEGEGQEATFKRIIKDGDKVYLKAENPIYPMRDMTGVPFTVCGVVVEKRKCYV